MIRSLVVLLVVVCGCGGSVNPAWLGTWKGAASFNTGRAPVPFTGQLVVTEASGQLQLVATSDAQGTPKQSFTCTVSTTTVTEGSATVPMDASCTMTPSPADDCTYVATFAQATLTRTANALEATGQGRLKATCTSTGSAVVDFSMTLSATK